MKAKAESVTTAWWSTTEAFQVMVRATTEGLPAATPSSIPLNPREPAVNMKGWSWRTPSSSHTEARASWRTRRPSGGRQARSPAVSVPTVGVAPAVFAGSFMVDRPRPFARPTGTHSRPGGRAAPGKPRD